MYDSNRQFELAPEEFFRKLDLLNWYRYFCIVKALGRLQPATVLEVGPGEGTIRRVCEPYVQRYATLDRNPKLGVDYVGDVRTELPKLKGKFDAVIAADILEHIPFADVKRALQNLWGYLRPGGYALITIPHRAHYLWGMTSLTKTHSQWLVRIPTLKKLLGRKVAIDSDHEWEVGDGRHAIKDVEQATHAVGFVVERRERLPYVDFWVLQKTA